MNLQLFGGRAADNLQDGMRLTVNQSLDAAEGFLGKGYRDMGGGRFVSADGLRQVRMGDSDILGRHAGGPHMNFEIMRPDPNRPGRFIVEENIHVYLIGD